MRTLEFFNRHQRAEVIAKAVLRTQPAGVLRKARPLLAKVINRLEIGFMLCHLEGLVMVESGPTAVGAIYQVLPTLTNVTSEGRRRYLPVQRRC